MSLQPVISNFNDGYYLVDGIYVEPDENVNVPKINDYDYGVIQEDFYGDVQCPILFKHQNSKYYFRVEPSGNVPAGTLHLPHHVVSDLEIDTPPSREQFLLAKPGHAKTLTQFQK